MSAGGSQAVQATRTLLSGFWSSKQRERAARQAGRHAAGCRGERAVCAALSRAALRGVQHLDDRRYRADESCLVNVDHLVVAPTGVFVVDAKNWAGRLEVRDGHLLQDGVPRDERLIALNWLTHRVEEVLLTSGYVVRPTPVVCFASTDSDLPETLGSTQLTDLSRLETRLTAGPVMLGSDDIQSVTALLSYAFPPYDVDPAEVAEAEGLLFPDDEVRHAAMRACLERPIAEWMVWLLPEQAYAVRRSFAGPGRLRGAAGTGKTSVALHRVAWLAETRPGRLLVTSYVKTLPQVLAISYARLSPRTADRVDFVHLHRVALDLLAQRGRTVRPDLGRTSFNAAWAQHKQALAGTGLAKSYFEEEVESVIKGRALPDLQAYLALDRVGRRTPLRADLRREVWALAQRYDEELRSRGVIDLVDVLRMARDSVRAQPCTTWAGIVVDEMQDLPLVGLQLLHELAGRDRPDGLLLVGDGQQAIYPGGFRLSEAGISVAGRSLVFKTNYRNTVEILATARAIAFDGADSDESAHPAVDVVRHGELPCADAYASLEEHDAALVWDLQRLLSAGSRADEVAVLCQTNAMADAYVALLVAHGVPACLLKEPNPDAVLVGTWFRSKGLEFAHVFLPQADKRTMLLTGAGTAAQEEKAELLRRQKWVAMTRARDTLWVGRLSC